jgi:hypothetical protein
VCREIASADDKVRLISSPITAAPVSRCTRAAARPRPDPTSTKMSEPRTGACSTTRSRASTELGRYGTQPLGSSGPSFGRSPRPNTTSSHPSRIAGGTLNSAARNIPRSCNPRSISERTFSALAWWESSIDRSNANMTMDGGPSRHVAFN